MNRLATKSQDVVRLEFILQLGEKVRADDLGKNSQMRLTNLEAGCSRFAADDALVVLLRNSLIHSLGYMHTMERTALELDHLNPQMNNNQRPYVDHDCSIQIIV